MFDVHIVEVQKKLTMITEKIVKERNPTKLLKMFKSMQRMIDTVYMSKAAENNYQCAMTKCKTQLDTSIRSLIENLETICASNKDTTCQMAFDASKLSDILKLFSMVMYQSLKMMINLQK